MSLAFRPHDQISLTVETVGAEASPVMVIDQLAAEPEALVDLAASLAPFSAPQRAYYPGLTAPVPMAYARALQACLDPAIRATFGLGAARVVGGACDFSMVTRRPEDLHPRQRVPHIDSTDPGFLALLLYLCPAQRGGTSFYRHRRTGFEVITPRRLDAYEAQIGDEIAAAPPPEACITGDTALFERIGGQDAVFNRMLIYRGAALHSGDIRPDFAFDPDPARGRLTLNLFLQYR